MGSNASRADATTTGARRERRRRYEPRAMYELADTLRRQGVDFVTSSGPWKAAAHMLSRPGRAKRPILPVVTNGATQVMVDTLEHARDLAGLLNWCGIQDLNPVPDLIPPPELVGQGA